MTGAEPDRFSKRRIIGSLLVATGLVITAALFGNLPTGLSRRGTPTLLISGLVALAGLIGVSAAAAAVPPYLRVHRYTLTDTDSATNQDTRVATRGTVQPKDDVVPAVLADADAVVRRTRVLSAPIDGNATTDYVEHAVTERATQFTIDDGTGAAIVDATESEVALPEATKQTFPPTRTLPDGVAAHVDQVGATVDTDTRRLRIQEALLEPGDSALVMGRSNAQVTADLITDADYPSRLRSRIFRYGAGGCVVTLTGSLGVFFTAGVI